MPLPGGGAVLDTPGVRAVGLLDGAAGLDRAFADIAELAAGCRYGDCAHDAEPGCAVRDALEDGALPVRRWESWRRLQREIEYEGGRRAARLAAERRGGWRGGRRRTGRPAHAPGSRGILNLRRAGRVGMSGSRPTGLSWGNVRETEVVIRRG